MSHVKSRKFRSQWINFFTVRKRPEGIASRLKPPEIKENTTVMLIGTHEYVTKRFLSFSVQKEKIREVSGTAFQRQGFSKARLFKGRFFEGGFSKDGPDRIFEQAAGPDINKGSLQVLLRRSISSVFAAYGTVPGAARMRSVEAIAIRNIEAVRRIQTIEVKQNTSFSAR